MSRGNPSSDRLVSDLTPPPAPSVAARIGRLRDDLDLIEPRGLDSFYSDAEKIEHAINLNTRATVALAEATLLSVEQQRPYWEASARPSALVDLQDSHVDTVSREHVWGWPAVGFVAATFLLLIAIALVWVTR